MTDSMTNTLSISSTNIKEDNSYTKNKQSSHFSGEEFCFYSREDT